jgi:hypothetical protein
MVTEELVDLIAETIHKYICDNVRINTKDYVLLTEMEKNYYLSLAHDIIVVFDDYYDAELDADDDDDMLDDYDDPYEEEESAMEDNEW